VGRGEGSSSALDIQVTRENFRVAPVSHRWTGGRRLSVGYTLPDLLLAARVYNIQYYYTRSGVYNNNKKKNVIIVVVYECIKTDSILPPDKGFITYYYNIYVFRSERPETLLSIHTGYQKELAAPFENSQVRVLYENAINKKTFSDFILVYIRTTASRIIIYIYIIIYNLCGRIKLDFFHRTAEMFWLIPIFMSDSFYFRIGKNR